MQVESLRRALPGQLTVQQLDRALEAYLLWLFGYVLFTTGAGDTVSARWIHVAREIADAQNPQDVRDRSWGSAVLAATFRGLCTACFKAEGRPTLMGCPLLLQLWCFEVIEPYCLLIADVLWSVLTFIFVVCSGSR